VVHARLQLSSHPLGRGKKGEIIRRAAIGLALFLAAVLCAAVFVAGVYIYRHYVAHLPAVDAIVRELSDEELSPAAAVTQTISKLANPGLESFVARSLIGELHPQPVRMLHWHLRGFLWANLLPHHLTDTEMLGLYLHFMQFEGGRGLIYGAGHYYGKVPAELTEREVLELFAISVSPSANSPTHNPERFKAAVERLQARLGAPAA
jgi:hypothetical protein